MVEQGSRKFGNYVLHERIGIGGMAEIFRATAEVDEVRQSLVIKRILSHLSEDEAFVRMFIEEAKLCIFLRHPNIVQVYDLGIVDDQYFIAMEYVEGRDLLKTLAACARQRVAFPTDLALYIILQVLKALDYAHNLGGADGRHLGIIHRDVSPPNILLSYSGEIKLSDFGIAKASFREKTRTGIFKGKFGYMSPEQAMGETLDRRSDIFAVGILLYELLTGHRLFTGPNEVAIIEQVRTATVKPALKHYRPDIGPELHRIVMKSLARRREDRFASAADLHETIYNYTFHNGVVLSPRTLGRFMNKLFPVATRLVGEPVVGEPSWNDASSILDVSDSVILGFQNNFPDDSVSEENITPEEFDTVNPSEDLDPRPTSRTKDTNVEHYESELAEVLAGASQLRDESVKHSEEYTHQPTPFGGVPVLNIDSGKQDVLVDEALSSVETGLEIGIQTGLETIQGDEDFIDDEQTALEDPPIQPSQDTTIEKTDGLGDDTNLIFEDSSLFKQLAALPSDALDLDAPFASDDFEERTRAEALPAALLQEIEQARNARKKIDEDFVSLQGTEQSVQEESDDEDHDLPTSLGALDELGAADEIAKALGLEHDDPPQEQSTGVRDAISESARVDEEIEEIRRASVIESNEDPVERTALGELIGSKEGAPAGSAAFWTPPSEDDEKVSASQANEFSSHHGTEQEEAFLHQNETIERHGLDEEGRRDVDALSIQDGGRLKDRGASDLFGALAILDDEESIGEFPSSFDGTDNSITDFSDNVSALAQDPAARRLASSLQRREILAPSVLAAKDDENDESESQKSPSSERERGARGRPASGKKRPRVRPNTPDEIQEERTPFAPGSLVPEDPYPQDTKPPLPGFVESKVPDQDPQLLSDSFDLEYQKPKADKANQLRKPAREPSAIERESSAAKKQGKVVQKARAIREKNAAPIIRREGKSKLPEKVIPQSDTRTFPGAKLRIGRRPDAQIPEPKISNQAIDQGSPRPESFVVPEPDSHNILVWGFVLLAFLFVTLAAGIRFSSDDTLVGIKQVLGLIGPPAQTIILPNSSTVSESVIRLDETKIIEKKLAKPDSGFAPPSSEALKPATQQTPSKAKEKPQPSRSSAAKKIKRRPRPKKRAKKKSAPSRRKTRRTSTPKKRRRRVKKAAPLDPNKGVIKWSCQSAITVRIRRVGVFKSMKRKTVQVKPGNYVITVIPVGGGQSTKNTRVIAGEVAKIPCN